MIDRDEGPMPSEEIQHRLGRSLGDVIRAEAEARQVPLATLAQYVPVSRSALYRWFDGERAMPVYALHMIADRLMTTSAVLISRAEERMWRP